MGLLVKHIQDHPGGRKSFRRQYPLHLRPHLSGTQLRVSLGRPDEEGFLARYELAAARWDADVATAERKYAGAYHALTSDLIAYLTGTWKTDVLAVDEEARWTSRPAARKREAKERLHASTSEDLQEALSLRALGDIDLITAQWGQAAQDHAEGLDYVVDRHALEFSNYVRAFHDAQIEAMRIILLRLTGEDVSTPEEPEKPHSGDQGGIRRKKGSLRLLETFDAYATSQGISAGIKVEWRRYIQHLVDFLGHEDAQNLTREDVVRWRDHLIETPTRYGKVRKPVTVKDNYMTSLRCTLAWAVEEQKLSHNVAADVKVRVPKGIKTRDPDFTMDEAKAILRASLTPPTGKLSAPYVKGRRWIPWLCAYSGARVNELTQLRKGDIREVDGIWTMNITPEAGRVKNREARVVPLHAHVIEQGFLEMVEAQPDGVMFYDPDGKRVAGDDDRLYKKAGERLASWVRKEVGITDLAIKPNHAWRHLFKTLCADAGIQERVADAIQGHAAGTVAGRYGKVSLKAKADAIEKFPRFDVKAR